MIGACASLTRASSDSDGVSQLFDRACDELITGCEV